jgi:hypothetical protein
LEFILKRWLQKIRAINWIGMLWNIFGYATLLFFTATFAGAMYTGRQMAAVNSLIFCTILMWLLPPYNDFSWKLFKKWVNKHWIRVMLTVMAISFLLYLAV